MSVCLVASIYSNVHKQRDFTVRKIHSVTDTFLSLVSSDDTDLLVKVGVV